jgi:hypothetical protein
MPELDDVLKLSEDVRFRIMNHEGVIVRQDSGEILAVNASGVLVLQAVDGHRPVREIIGVVESAYDVPGENLQRDVLEFITEMLDAGVFKI